MQHLKLSEAGTSPPEPVRLQPFSAHHITGLQLNNLWNVDWLGNLVDHFVSLVVLEWMSRNHDLIGNVIDHFPSVTSHLGS